MARERERERRGMGREGKRWKRGTSRDTNEERQRYQTYERGKGTDAVA